MKRVIGAVALNGKVKINYEQVKNYMGYEDYFLENILKPFLSKNGIKHHFSGEFIVLEKGE